MLVLPSELTHEQASACLRMLVQGLKVLKGPQVVVDASALTVFDTSALAVLLTGLARSYWGMKGAPWYWGQPLLHAKLTLFALVLLLAVAPTRRFARWQATLRSGGGLPSAPDVQATRRLVMIEAHALVVLPLLGVWLARGIATRAL